MGGSPALRWMSLALARRATWRISFSSIRRRAYHRAGEPRHGRRLLTPTHTPPPAEMETAGPEGPAETRCQALAGGACAEELARGELGALAGAGLTGQPAALRVHEHVELAHLVDELERLDQDHLRRLAAEVGVHGAAVDGDVARAGREAHAGDGLLAAADDDGELGHRFLVTARASAPRASARRGGAHRRRRP